MFLEEPSGGRGDWHVCDLSVYIPVHEGVKAG